jgi:hypothetical protein
LPDAEWVRPATFYIHWKREEMTAPAYSYTHLGHLDILHDRPFTDPSLNADDLHSMRYMASRLFDLLNGPAELPDSPRPLQISLAGKQGEHVRVILNHPAALRAANDLHIVGFFGQTRPEANRTAIDGMDVTLQSEFAAYPAVLGYCTVRLIDGNFGNLVFLGTDVSREHWRQSTHHQYAAAELAPQYYASVRLHNGSLPEGLKSEPEIILKRTKYYDYQDGLWCGLRELQ